MESTTEQPNIKGMRNALKQSKGTRGINVKNAATMLDFMMDIMQLSPKQEKPTKHVKSANKRPSNKAPIGVR